MEETTTTTTIDHLEEDINGLDKLLEKKKQSFAHFNEIKKTITRDDIESVVLLQKISERFKNLIDHCRLNGTYELSETYNDIFICLLSYYQNTISYLNEDEDDKDTEASSSSESLSQSSIGNKNKKSVVTTTHTLFNMYKGIVESSDMNLINIDRFILSSIESLILLIRDSDAKELTELLTTSDKWITIRDNQSPDQIEISFEKESILLRLTETIDDELLKYQSFTLEKYDLSLLKHEEDDDNTNNNEKNDNNHESIPTESNKASLIYIRPLLLTYAFLRIDHLFELFGLGEKVTNLDFNQKLKLVIHKILKGDLMSLGIILDDLKFGKYQKHIEKMFEQKK